MVYSLCKAVFGPSFASDHGKAEPILISLSCQSEAFLLGKWSGLSTSLPTKTVDNIDDNIPKKTPPMWGRVKSVVMTALLREDKAGVGWGTARMNFNLSLQGSLGPLCAHVPLRIVPNHPISFTQDLV